MNSRRFVDGRLMSSFFKLLGDIRHHLKIHCRCSKETYLDENTLLNYRWQSSADQLPKSVSNFIKKAPIKEVTCYSPNLGRSFALALVKNGLNKKGDTLFAPMPNKTIEVEVTDPVFIDPLNERISI